MRWLRKASKISIKKIPLSFQGDFFAGFARKILIYATFTVAKLEFKQSAVGSRQSANGRHIRTCSTSL